MKRTLLAVTTIGLALCMGVQAQEDKGSVAFQLGLGYTTAVGRGGTYLDPGWNLTYGAGYNFNSHFGTLIDFGYSRMGINSTTLNNIGVPGGDVGIMSFTLDPIVHLNGHGHFDVYLTGGGGLYHRTQEFTQASVTNGVGFNPYFGFYPTVVPVTQILSSYSVNKPGWDAGIGIAVGTRWHGKLYAEAKYNEMYNGHGYHTAYLPVSFGFRW